MYDNDQSHKKNFFGKGSLTGLSVIPVRLGLFEKATFICIIICNSDIKPVKGKRDE